MRNWIGMLAGFLLVNLINYLFIRDILWSIVRAHEKKYRKFRLLKSQIKQSEPFSNRISMLYLLKYATTYRTDFLFWWRLKRIFVFVTSLLAIIYVVIALNYYQMYWFKWISLLLLLYSFAMIVFLRLQYGGVTGHLTKYDRDRMK